MNLYVVAKPYDIDQVISNERNQDSQKDLWLVLNLDKKTPSVCLEYLSELNQKNIGVEIMNISSACSSHNILLAEKRNFISIFLFG